MKFLVKKSSVCGRIFGFMVLIMLLGAPGAGKGSIAQHLVQKHGFLHLSTGKIFRKIKEDSKKASAGVLVSDDVVNETVAKTLKEFKPEDRIILDGYPRTQVQAEFLAKHYPVKAVFLLTNISDEHIIKRLSSRLLCKQEDHSFNAIYRPPRQEGICDFDGSELYRRPDDQPEIIKKRLDVYRQHTQPMIDYYKKNNMITEINADQDMLKMVQTVLDHLEKLDNK